jgi:hypothetical protein
MLKFCNQVCSKYQNIRQGLGAVAYTARNRVTKFKFCHADVLHIHLQIPAPAVLSPVIHFVTLANPPHSTSGFCQLICPISQLTALHQHCQA